MSCKVCNKLKGAASASGDAPLKSTRPPLRVGTVDVTSGLPYLLVPGTQYVGSSKFRRALITSCVIPSMKEPRGGWGINLIIHGQAQFVTASGPRQMHLAVKQLLELNEIPFTDTDLWLNLNFEWLSRAVMRYQKITLADLQQVAIPNPDYNEEEI